MDADRAIAELEAVVGQDVQRRNIGPLAAHARGSLAAAADSIARHPAPSVAIITGFFLAHGDPPNGETDGPPGAVALAAGLAAVGVPCRLTTDAVNARVLRATAAAAAGGLDGRVPVEVVAMPCSDGGASLELVRGAWLSARPPLSHVIAIERCGPSRDGTPRDARGEDIAAVNAPLEALFAAGRWATVGIGDLGNEVGMGSLPYELVAASVPRGDRLWCRVACDFPIVCGVSNWGAAGLLGALALRRCAWAQPLFAHMDPDLARRLLEAAVRDGGAVSSAPDGGPPRPRLCVDGIPWRQLDPVYRRLQEICRGAVEAPAQGAAGRAETPAAP